MKKVARSDIIGQRGMAHIDGVVHSMGYVFYPSDLRDGNPPPFPWLRHVFADGGCAGDKLRNALKSRLGAVKLARYYYYEDFGVPHPSPNAF
ncbi:hypothetical protein F9288_06170 [Sphingomonas sp. CL5.1]|uniref:hypothetical protein n=1 Tax=Sphingomonas sp. CL5.1 TaxID=2653203 RepID=UPI0015816A6B|nr:hypothetical protein [Sphingomonas sp. CL5.1]QKR98205.1 hypothetical protein F9288_06170 [Sphingomonas sp. CL5.1]